jgi:two-component sensor histidine kinase
MSDLHASGPERGADPQALMREEAHHRFLNTLTAIRGLLSQDFAGFEDPEVRDAVGTFEARLMAFAHVHRSLRASAAANRIDAPIHFGRLSAQLAAAYLAPRGHHCAFFADEGEMDADVGETLGLIIVELVTNAAKHAFTAGSSGCVSIELRRKALGWACTVQDDGGGLRPEGGGDLGGGAGMRLIKALASDIGAELTIRSDGSGVLVNVHAPDRVGRPRRDN